MTRRFGPPECSQSLTRRRIGFVRAFIEGTRRAFHFPLLAPTLPMDRLASFARFSRLVALVAMERREDNVKIGFVRAVFRGL